MLCHAQNASIGKKAAMRKQEDYQVVWPRSKQSVDCVRLAKRLETLEGKTVCTLWDGVYRGDEIFPIIEKELAKRYPGIKFVGHEIFGCTHGADEAKVLAALPDNLKQNRCDAVLSGIGC